MPGNARSEAEIQREILLALGARSDCRIWRVNTGFARSPKSGRCVRFGQPGAADIQGLALPGGRFLAIEVKSARGRQSAEQKAWGAMVRRFGGVYVVARSVEDALAALEEAKT